ncbi:DUF2169 domain-containing protein [Flavobacterium sp. FlaQc-48]|uniref:DUF2169 domain-containing protein n=1 Tax=Flavobacterium sp. FlaQc-48 TaxID=3374181 RepID=UPI0037563FB8
MRVVKPFRLSLLNRTFRFETEDILGVALLGMISMEPQSKLRAETDLWKLVQNELNGNGVLDLGIPKSLAEFLVSGYVYTNHQAEKTACMAQIKIEQIQKNIVAFGDRFWIDDKATQPALRSLLTSQR